MLVVSICIIFLLSVGNVNAENQWDRSCALWGCANQMSSLGPTSSPSSRWHALSVSHLNHFYLFGGYGFSDDNTTKGDLFDLWSWDPETMIWTHIAGDVTVRNGGENVTAGLLTYSPYHVPASRRSSTGFFSSLSSTLVLFGGSSRSESIFSNETTNDLWEICLESSSKCSGGSTLNQWRKLQPHRAGTVFDTLAPYPYPRSGSSLTAITGTEGDVAYLYGGLVSVAAGAPYPILSDLWRFSLTQNKWKFIGGSQKVGQSINPTVSYADLPNIASSLNWPAPSYAHSMYSVTSDLLVLFGGQGLLSDQTYSAIWSFNTSSTLWTLLSSGGSDAFDTEATRNCDSSNFGKWMNGVTCFPGARKDFGSWVFENDADLSISFFGGLDSEGNILGDVWSFSVLRRQWYVMEPSSGSFVSNVDSNGVGESYPSTRSGVSTWEYKHRFYVGFGRSVSTFYSDMWTNTLFACSLRGDLETGGSCTCNDEGSNGDNSYLFGEFCERSLSVCYGHNASSSLACGGAIRGYCLSTGTCHCHPGWTGTECTLADESSSTVPLLEWPEIVAISVTSSAVVCVVVVLILFICIVLCVVNSYKKRLEETTQRVGVLNELEDLDSILEEQRQKRRKSVAHLELQKQTFEVSYDDIKVLTKIASGGSAAIVYLAEFGGAEVCFKVFSTDFLASSDHSFDEFEQECATMAALHHPNIINFIGATLKPPRVGILMEYAAHGDIMSYMEKRPGALPIPEKLRILSEISAALTFVHSSGYIHRDVKAQNILLTQSNVSKLTDFGGATSMYDLRPMKTLKGKVGTATHMSPEQSRGESTKASDVFSYGVVIFEVMTARPPYGSDVSIFNLERRVAADPTFRPDWNLFSSEAQDEGLLWLVELSTQCWNDDPGLRPPFEAINRQLRKKVLENTPISGSLRVGRRPVLSPVESVRSSNRGATLPPRSPSSPSNSNPQNFGDVQAMIRRADERVEEKNVLVEELRAQLVQAYDMIASVSEELSIERNARQQYEVAYAALAQQLAQLQEGGSVGSVSSSPMEMEMDGRVGEDNESESPMTM